jgi:hypothetical protein
VHQVALKLTNIGINTDVLTPEKQLTIMYSIDKITVTTLVVLLWIFISIWIFNHVEAWFGIAVFVLGIYISLKLIFKKSKKS